MDILKEKKEDKEMEQLIAEKIMLSSSAKCVVCMPRWNNLEHKVTSEIDIAELKKSNDDIIIVTETE